MSEQPKSTGDGDAGETVAVLETQAGRLVLAQFAGDARGEYSIRVGRDVHLTPDEAWELAVVLERWLRTLPPPSVSHRLEKWLMDKAGAH